MCTVTIVPRHPGFRLVCNRDELLARPAAEPPRLHGLGPRTAVFPIDPRGGGTWIGANDAGLVLCILNRNSDSPGRPPAFVARTRGRIVTSLLGCASLAEVLKTIGTLDVDAYLPFRLVVVAASRVAVVTSDAGRLEAETFALRRPVMVASSSLGDAVVEEARGALFRQMVQDQDEGAWLAGQSLFHRHRWKEQPALSVCMERRHDVAQAFRLRVKLRRTAVALAEAVRPAGAMTVSRSVVDVRADSIRFSYQAFGPRCRLVEAA